MPDLSCGMVGSSSLTRDQIRAPCSGSRGLNTAPPREVPTTLFFFFESWSSFFNFIGIQDTTRKTPETTWRQKTRHKTPPSSPDLAWGRRGVKRLGQTLSPSPARQAPGPQVAEGNGEAGPSPHIRTAEGRPPRKAWPRHPHSCAGAGSPQRPGVGSWTHSWLRSS